MPLVPSFAYFVQVLSPVMTRPTFDSLLVLVRGWLFAPRHTVTGMIVSADAQEEKHHSSFHRAFASARWSLDEMGLCVFGLLLSLLHRPKVAQGPVLLAVDDTLCRKQGKNVYGAGMHHDPLLSSRGTAIVNRGHSWVVLGVLVHCPWLPCLTGRVFCLPILFRLYQSKQTLTKRNALETYKTRPELFSEMLALLCARFPRLRFHAVGDSAYGGKDVLLALPASCDLTSRLHLDARLYDALPERDETQKRGRGRPRKRGRLLATPRQMLSGRTTPLCLNIYGRRDTMRVATGIAFSHALPQRPLCIVAVKPDSDKRSVQAFFSTNHTANPAQILLMYARRWAIEQTFQEAKQSLGFQEPQGWTEQAVLRTAPFGMILYTLVVLWFVKEGHASYQPPRRPWYARKARASFADILHTLRQQAITQFLFSIPFPTRSRQNYQHALQHALLYL